VSTDPTAPAPAPSGNGHTPAYPDHPNWAGPQRFALGAAVFGLGAFVALGLVNMAAAHGDDGKKQFFVSYLSGFVFWLSLPLGGMALLMIHYLAKTSWGILLKRPLEAATRTLPLTVVLFVPLMIGAFMGKVSPYWWSAPEAAKAAAEIKAESGENPDPNAAAKSALSGDEERRAKQWKAAKERINKAVDYEIHERQEATLSFLSPPMYVVWSLVIFAIWGVFIFFLNRWATDAETDTAKVEPSLEKLKNISGPGLIAFAITGTAAASLWVMSLEPSWASTMFPVIFAMNSFLTAFAFCLALFLTLASRPPLANFLRAKFQIDMGSLMLAFTLFWSYTSFSQLMLVWIGNLPEEIPFFLKRSMPTYGFWWFVSAVLIVFHFALPFLLLLFRDIKLYPKRLRAVALYLMVVCAIDVIWWIEPSMPHESNLLPVLMDVAAVVGVGGVWGLFFLWHLRQRPLLPYNETFWLPEGHHEAHAHDGHNGGHGHEHR
jgi:hypothetical protein